MHRANEIQKNFSSSQGAVQLNQVFKKAVPLERFAWSLLGILVCELGYLLSFSLAPFSIYKFGLFAVLGALIGDRAKRKNKSNESKKRILQIRRDFPYFAENLSLCITAGLSPTMSIKAILENDLSDSEQRTLFIELKKFLSDIDQGNSATFALDRFAERINLPEIYRFVDLLIVTMERGTPLAEVLRQQAFDLREAQRREFLDLGSKAEVKMMVPVVFLILPVSILFALWPSLYQLNQMSAF
ncbi:unannotated protein [freshwater metagenome]|uniref:Unannotated protein n=1 Tax=freshwater metagenome TaxID=449393 RepID=A0A6J7D8V6_9ZZZZ|nr:hypothetical protein [Actinomycetota bacterium]